ncbi:MAG: sigma 54-interacting transcriptional regulator, partial [Anaerolineae bacterium]|nr:sigma 54-interacting transcriptional regulator [Anaerolineae bacterium]
MVTSSFESITHLNQVWWSFVETGNLEQANLLGVEPCIMRSWQRCSLRLNPRSIPRPTILPATSFVGVLQNQFDLLAIARPLLEDIYQLTEDTRCAIVLADAAACILDIIGSVEIVGWLQHRYMRPGTYWNENQMGTNSIALALNEAMPVRVPGALHYLEALHSLNDVAAPIHDVSGRVIGVLAVVAMPDMLYPLDRSLVMASARAIENHLQTDMYYHDVNRRMTELNSLLTAISEGIISWNADGVIMHINARAGEILGLKPRTVQGRPMVDILGLPSSVQNAINARQSLQDVEASLRVDGRMVECLISIRPITQVAEASVGYLLSLQPIQQVRRLVNRMVGAHVYVTLGEALIRTEATSEVWEQVKLAARGTSPVLLRGESGVGKTTIARAIHNEGNRSSGPFISINCTTLPHELMISEFLGYEGGAFSGALEQGRPSKFEMADGGTLFLDEVEGLTLKMQAALLQVIETGVVMRLGATRPIPVNVRIIAATSVDLIEKVSAGHFRRDLYYYLSAYTIVIPPLRERVEDIQFLSQRFLNRYSHQHGRQLRISRSAMTLMQRYPWPGNVR